MLRRAHYFLREGGYAMLMLPKACFENSRYLTYGHFETIVTSIGFVVCHKKQSTKLAFYVLRKDSAAAHPQPKTVIPRRLIRGGKERNNFCIILSPSASTINE